MRHRYEVYRYTFKPEEWDERRTPEQLPIELFTREKRIRNITIQYDKKYKEVIIDLSYVETL